MALHLLSLLGKRVPKVPKSPVLKGNFLFRKKSGFLDTKMDEICVYTKFKKVKRTQAYVALRDVGMNCK